MSPTLKILGYGLVGAVGGVAAGYGTLLYCWSAKGSASPVCNTSPYLWAAAGALVPVGAVYLLTRKR